ncbi:DUF6587 family protein [Tahibacter amnicola]|uniref:Uncharacterized protein n=1 Tax=Tahibacter amnicola TaxID=2976241 RepID=A0ABY6BAK1_9GAMM|nr:DUF6587 family protein [Tahibacter amnicola]UXI67086.1 hypothetical protein N4264_20400 [Tahibacter amnicola]
MSETGLMVQYVIIAVVVGVSAVSTLRRLAPSVFGRLLAMLSRPLERSSLAVVRRAGHGLRQAIPAAVGGACGSSGGCSRCGACPTTSVPAQDVAVMPLAPPRPLR